MSRGHYTGIPKQILDAVERDSRAAVEFAKVLRRRAEVGDNIVDELIAESEASVWRAEAAVRFSKDPRWVKQVLRILGLDAESSGIRRGAAYVGIGEAARDHEPIRPRFSLRAEAAARFIATHAGGVGAEAILEDPSAAKSAYRRAAKRLHPDVGGDTRKMQQLEEANQALRSVWN